MHCIIRWKLPKKHSVVFWQMVWPTYKIGWGDPVPTNVRELWTAITTALLNISPRVFWSLVESMPCQILALCQTQEDLTQYEASVILLWMHQFIWDVSQLNQWMIRRLLGIFIGLVCEYFFLGFYFQNYEKIMIFNNENIFNEFIKNLLCFFLYQLINVLTSLWEDSLETITQGQFSQDNSFFLSSYI